VSVSLDLIKIFPRSSQTDYAISLRANGRGALNEFRVGEKQKQRPPKSAAAMHMRAQAGDVLLPPSISIP